VTRIVWTLQAVEDVEAIRSYIARDSAHYAALTAERIVDSVERLKEFPRSGRVVPELEQRRRSPTASSTATRSASTSRSKPCATMAGATAAAPAAWPVSPGLPRDPCDAALYGRHRVTSGKSNLPASVAARGSRFPTHPARNSWWTATWRHMASGRAVAMSSPIELRPSAAPAESFIQRWICWMAPTQFST